MKLASMPQRVAVAGGRLAAPGSHDLVSFETRFLRGLPIQDRDSVLAAAVYRRLPARAIVTNQDDPADYLFMITEGSARHYYTTSDGKKILLQWLAAGDVFGGMALLPSPAGYIVSTEMVKDSTVAVWDRELIRRLVEKYPRLLENSLMIASDYLVWYVASHSALFSRNARERLAHVLASLSIGVGRKVPGGIELHLGNEELANAANVTPFTASRLLSQWQRDGALTKSRGKVLLRDSQRLLPPRS
jgi:CRP-like cAMP-binding protein